MRRPHGVRGGVLIESLSDVANRFEPGAELELVHDGRRKTVRVTAAAPHGDALRVQFEGIDDRDAVEAIRGAIFEVPRASTPQAPDGAYYFFELVGCSCRDRRAGPLGVVQDVLEDGGGLLLAVEGVSGSVLIPFVESFIVSIDIEAHRIELDLPEGLIDVCAST